jgi:hypothetical protein
MGERDAEHGETTAMATKTKVGFGVSCPLCGCGDEAITLDVNDLTKLSCQGCSEEFTPAEALAKARATLARWEKVVAWIDSAEALIGG